MINMENVVIRNMKEEDVVDAIKKNHKLKFMETVNQGDWRAIMAQKILD